MALCRAMGLPQGIAPAALRKAMEGAAPELVAEAETYAAQALQDSDDMRAWSPPDHRHDVDPFVGLYTPPGVWEHYCLHGGRGGAKSTEIAAALVHHARKRKEVIVCARQFQNSIEASSKSLIEEQIEEAGAASEFEITDQHIKHKRTGSEFSFIGLDRNVQSIKSMTGVTIFWIEEAEAVNAASLKVLLPTVRSAGSRFIWSYNPEEPDSPVNALFRGDVPPPEGSKVFGVNVEHNKYFFRTRLPSEMRSAWARQKDFNHIWRGGYAEVTDADIFTDIEAGYLDYSLLTCGGTDMVDWGGMDFGYGGDDPSAAVSGSYVPVTSIPGFTPEAGYKPILYIRAESVQRAVPNHELHRLVSDVGAGHVLCDSAQPLMIAAINAAGAAAHGAAKGPGSVLAGLRKLQSCRILISPDCPITFEEFQKLRWVTDPKTGKVVKPLRPTGSKHCVDAVRYGTSEIDLTYATGVDYV